MARSTRRAHRSVYGALNHPLIVLTAAGVILATLVATLATTPTTPGWHTLPSVTWPAGEAGA